MNRDPDNKKHWVALVDGNNTQIDILRNQAIARGIDLTIIVDIIHVIEYLWEAGRAFHPSDLEKWVQYRLFGVLQYFFTHKINPI